MNSAVWKFIAGILVSALISGAATLHETTGEFATKTEMHDALKGDHELIKETRDDVKDIRGRLDAIQQQMGELRGMLAAGAR